ncbi:SLC13 family permease [Brooklawnia cerclae]|uniref:Di/tricarboxylate transporter n=1 Tax=Brooklawnia cerclae TaxID=349934 RepID=A0ABX0SAG4_9ACTN|nr:di/tricarboxylate transporter [Brooklawnia cerclae]
MGISTAALVSLIALAVIVIISCFRDMNVGILAIAAGIAIGMALLGMKLSETFASWPISLFMTLTGVTFMFSCAQVNGTMEKLTAHTVRLARTNTAFIPLTLFLLVTAITTIGPGNIATVALLAPTAMAIAGRIGLPAFAMTLLIVGAADGAAFSPIAPTGIISNSLIAAMAPQLGITEDQLPGIGWKMYFNSEIAQSVVNLGGFFLLGGGAWMRKQKSGGIDIDEIAPKPEPFTPKQWSTLAGMVVLIVMVIFFKWDVGMTAFFISAAFLLLGIADDSQAIKEMPWGVIVMVCGMSLLIGIMDQAGGLAVIANSIGAISNPITVTGVLALVSGVVSAYSSSSGVVMPTFLPMVPGIIQEIGGGDPISLISSINVGAHLVDTSPLSVFGALCLACAAEHEDKAKLFRHLLFWGLSMAVVGAIICLVCFGVLGL